MPRKSKDPYALKMVKVKDAKGRVTNKTISKIASNFSDPYAPQCKMAAIK